ncbi:hypothetical protein GCM10011588_25970 [Nocardia jinanensis]|uniref:Uncharacterized protein n=1 Tax=Nocardia jinanensis TaxID=382504 RepID=A0A917RJU2_9NOCA|nr:hypothetical protein GCM10011588_25970 [Nocardia jinanensis]
MAQLVRGDVPDPGDGCSAAELEADGLLGESSAVVGEQELGRFSGAWVRYRSSGTAYFDDPVDEFDCFVVEWDHAFGVESSEWDFQPGSFAGNLVEAVDFEVEQFPDPQAAGSREQQRRGGEFVVTRVQGLGEAAVGVDRDVAWQRFRQEGNVVAEHQFPASCVGPSPFGDLGEEGVDRDDAAGVVGDADRLPVLLFTASTKLASQGSIWRRRSSSVSRVRAGSRSVRNRPNPVSRVAMLETVWRVQVPRLALR